MNAMTSLDRFSPARRLILRTAGHRQGFITRLVSPGDLGELLKPFVFLDFFESPTFHDADIPAHPHSGIATHTTLLRGSIRYADSSGKFGTLREGSVEWMRAGGGVWHWGSPRHGEAIRGYQLWLALPPALEGAPAESQYVDASSIEQDGRVRVLLGSHGNMASPIPSPSPLSYLHVRLEDGERWTYQPPPHHDVAWLATHGGAIEVAGVTLRRELAVFESGNAPIELVARGQSELVLGSAVRHPHPLVTGTYSVHTSRAALAAGEEGIRRLAREGSELGAY
jgi:redox-sensitive bicupin YhaK (pirin superfamily)